MSESGRIEESAPQNASTELQPDTLLQSAEVPSKAEQEPSSTFANTETSEGTLQAQSSVVTASPLAQQESSYAVTVPQEVQDLIDSIPLVNSRSRCSIHSSRDAFMRSTYPQASTSTIVGGARSQIGPQLSSEKRTAPAYGFGSANRFVDPEKLFISKEHSRTQLPSWTPAPHEYCLHNTLADKFGALPKISRPNLGGTEPRFDLQTRTERYYQKIPGPGQYKVSLAAQHVSTHHEGPPIGFSSGRPRLAPSKGFEREFYGCESPGPIYRLPSAKRTRGAFFPTASRPMDPNVVTVEEKRAAEVPGPGEYVAGSVFQPPRDTPLAHSAQFSKAPRDKASMVSLASEFADKVLQGATTPGAKYDTELTQSRTSLVSKYRSPARTTFAKSVRLPKVKSATPGPGTYVV